MDLRNIRNKVNVIRGHASHLSRAAGELPKILAANPEIDLTAEIVPMTESLVESSELADGACETHGGVIESLSPPKKSDKTPAKPSAEKDA